MKYGKTVNTVKSVINFHLKWKDVHQWAPKNMENGWLIFISKKTYHYLLIIWTLQNSGIAQKKLRKCVIAKILAKWRLRKMLFFAQKVKATKKYFCVPFRKNCAKVLRTKTLVSSSLSVFFAQCGAAASSRKGSIFVLDFLRCPACSVCISVYNSCVAGHCWLSGKEGGGSNFTESSKPCAL